MENNEIISKETLANPKDESINRLLIIDSFSKENLLETSKWMVLLSIIGFIGVFFMAIAGFFLLLFGQNYMIGFINIIGSGLYIFPLTNLYKSATNLKKAIVLNNQLALTNGFVNLTAIQRKILNT